MKEFFEKNAKVFYAVLGCALLFFGGSLVFEHFRRPPEQPPVVDPKYFLNLESDMGRLECTFEQRRCLFENLGFSKEEVLGRCQDIDFCDVKYSRKK